MLYVTLEISPGMQRKQYEWPDVLPIWIITWSDFNSKILSEYFLFFLIRLLCQIFILWEEWEQLFKIEECFGMEF